jgi:hypothetical protein
VINAEFQAMLDGPTEETVKWLSSYQRECRRAWGKMVVGKLIELLSAHHPAGQNG